MDGTNKILYLESLRGIAALSVAVTHFRIGSNLNNEFTDNAGLMVDFFFVLSGFVISLSYQDNIRNFTHVYAFQARRFLRLYPLHLFMLLVFLGVECAKYIAETRWGLIANNPAFVKNDLASFVQNLFLVQNLLSPLLTWNAPSWSISAEFYTYLIFAAAVLVSSGQRRLILILSLFLALLSLSYLIRDLPLLPSAGIVRCTYSFFLGVVVYNFSMNHRGNVPNVVSYILFAASIFITTYSGHMSSPIAYQLIPVLYALLITSLVTTSEDNVLKRVLSAKLLIYLGTISYGIYMIHAFVWWIFNQVLRFVFGFKTSVDAGGITHIHINNAILSDLIMVIGLATVILLASFSYKLIEKPVNDFRHKLGRFE